MGSIALAVEARAAKHIAENELWPGEDVSFRCDYFMRRDRVMIEATEETYQNIGCGVFQGGALTEFIERGFIPTSVTDTKAWFKPVDVNISIRE